MLDVRSINFQKYTNPFYLMMNAKRSMTNRLRTSPELFLDKEFAEQRDPWSYENSLYEKERFEKLIRLVKQVPNKKILEIGCAEGHFTKLLTKVCKDITATDCSTIAIQRAKKRAREAKYFHTSLPELKGIKKTFDLIICSEVLCYVDKKQEAINTMRKYGKYILTSNAGLLAFAIRPYFSDLQLLKHQFHYRLNERKMTEISLWK